MLEETNTLDTSGSCIVKRFGYDDAKRWDDYVEDAPRATFFHREAWRGIIEKELGHRCHYLYAERDGAITGILPLAEIRSRLFGHSLISTPFCVYGGIVASDSESEAQLTQAATALADELRVDYLELRDRELRHPEWPIKELYVTFSKPIHPTEETKLESAFRQAAQHGSQRYNCRAGGAP